EWGSSKHHLCVEIPNTCASGTDTIDPRAAADMLVQFFTLVCRILNLDEDLGPLTECVPDGREDGIQIDLQLERVEGPSGARLFVPLEALARLTDSGTGDNIAEDGGSFLVSPGLQDVHFTELMD